MEVYSASFVNYCKDILYFGQNFGHNYQFDCKVSYGYLSPPKKFLDYKKLIIETGYVWLSDEILRLIIDRTVCLDSCHHGILSILKLYTCWLYSWRSSKTLTFHFIGRGNDRLRHSYSRPFLHFIRYNLLFLRNRYIDNEKSVRLFQVFFFISFLIGKELTFINVIYDTTWLSVERYIAYVTRRDNTPIINNSIKLATLIERSTRELFDSTSCLSINLSSLF